MLVYLFIYGESKWGIKDMEEWYKLCKHSHFWKEPNYIGMIKIKQFVPTLLEFRAMLIEEI